MHPAFDNERHGATGEGAGVALLRATLDAHTSDFARRVHARGGGRSVALRQESNLGRVDRALVDWDQREGAYLLVVSSHQRKGFERLWHASVSRSILHHAPMSVAVVLLAAEEPQTVRPGWSRMPSYNTAYRGTSVAQSSR